MYTFRDFVTESKTYPLYHGAPMDAALSILRSGFIRGRTFHEKGLVAANLKVQGPKISGVSSTRNFYFARRWSKDNLVFELDTQKISFNYRIVPVNYFSDGGRYNVARVAGEKNRKNEYEEFIIGGDLPIKRYLKRIYVSESTNKGTMMEIEKCMESMFGSSYKEKIVIGLEKRR